jgi:rhodanese-related sulfurtransferase
MQLARSRAFVGLLAPHIAAAFGAQPAFEPDNLWRLFTRVEPGLIRVDADELTYPAHVILRYEIERALVEGEVEAEDIPALWDEKMAALLGVDTRGNFRDGPLQDVHWAEGLFGYFPCYTLGAMYAAQWFAAMRRATPALDARIAAGDLAPVFDWLREHIWLAASRYETAELAQRASGEALNPAHDNKGGRHSTLGEEIAHNARLAQRERGAFVAMMKSLDLQMPTHVTEALRTNLSGGRTVAQMLAEAAARVPFMSLDELLARTSAPADAGHDELVVLDVREREAWLAGHVTGARSLPRGQLELRVNEELPDPTRRIVTCCEFGRISTLAAATLRDMGFQRAVALDGGMKAWREAGYPVKTGSAT